MELKRCSRCKQWKLLSEFYKDKRAKDGLQSRCKQCWTIYYREDKKRITIQRHKYREIHKEEVKEYNHQYYLKNKKRCNERDKEYRLNHQEQIKQYRLEHKEEKRKYESKYRSLGYNPLNEWFEGAHMHHINNNDVIFIPEDIHLKFNGNGFTTERHRNALLQYYGSIKNMINNNPIGGIR